MKYDGCSPHIALSQDDWDVSVWARVEKIDGDKLHFYVINGAWYGVFHPDKGQLEITSEEWTAPKGEDAWLPAQLVWQGVAQFRPDQYNEAIAWIREQIANPPAPMDPAAEGYSEADFGEVERVL